MIRNFTQSSPQQLLGLKSLAVAGLLFASLQGSAQTTFNYTGTMQTYTVPPGVTLIHIDAQGAQGGNVTIACAATGGLGARMEGDVTVTPGEVLSVLVGGQGQTNGEDGGGGGGSFVVRTGNVPLVVAGGGGGASNNIQICTGNRNGVNASITTSGTASANGLVAGGSPGNGGGANVGSGGGGGGFNTDGVGGSGNPNGRGRAYINGGAGGTGIANDHGGFGGGGSGWFYGGNGGGGGGYAGGGTDGNYPSTYFGGGGGGGSYNSGTNQVNTPGFRTGNGLVVITPIVVYNASIVQNSTIQCFGQTTASLTATVNGGTAPYTYSWAPSGGTAATASGLGAGTYTVTVTDAASAVTTQTFTITEPAALVASATAQTNILCNGGNNGSATVTGSGGTAPYTYQWSNGGNTQTINNLTMGVYTCTVTCSNGCTATQTVSLTEPAALAATTMQTNVSCNGGNNGDAMVMPTGGTPGYSYNWQPTGGTLASASGLTIGTYTCTITDANGCSTTQSVTITEPPALAATATSVSALCNGSSDGSASVTVTGGTPGYTYNWAPAGGTADTATGLPAGTYTCTITDANTCSMTQTVLVTEPDPLVVTPTSISALCNGNANGSASVTVFGGTSPYGYSWAPTGGNAATATGLAAGTYTCTITDLNNCVTTQTVQVTEPAVLTGVITTATNPIFCNGTNGSIDLTVNGGTPNYTYAWSNSANTQDVNGLAAGTYSVTITDANNCTTTQTVTLSDPNPPTVTLALPVSTVCAADGATVLSGGLPAGGTYSGPGVTGTLFTPASANIGMNTITYTYTDLATGCVGTNTDVIFVDACIGITESANTSSFIVFPNPNNGTFTLQLKTKDAATVLIYDALGKLISSTNVKPDVQQQLQMNEAGMYLVTVITADGARSTQRVTVTK